LKRHFLEDAVPHVKIVSQDLLYATDRDVETLAVAQMGLDLLGRPNMLTPFYIFRDALLQLLVLQLPSVPVRSECIVGMLRESYRLD
jgi:hypothetical protein